MTKALLIAILICSFTSIIKVAAQDYKIHTVAPKENYYSIGRFYNVSPKDIAAINNLNMEAGLQIGQKIKIPVGNHGSTLSTNTVKSPAPAAIKEDNTPVKHVVAQGESLFRISKTYNVAIEDLKQWNNLASDNVKVGQVLIINSNLTVKNETPNAIQLPTVVNKPVIAESTAPAPKKIAEDTALVYVSAAEPAKENARKEEPAPKAVSIRSGGYAPNASAKSEPVAESKNFESNAGDASASPEGAFSSAFVKGSNANILNGQAATFKSTSGWQDKKYYVLINDVAPGTILKIAAANKVVYAKVLGNMPEMKENNGLLMRISNAAASHLGILEDRFSVQVTY